MYCKSCGKIIDDTGIFCKYCGKFTGEESLSPGTLLYNGRYEIIEIIKTGGMGRIYKGHDRNLHGLSVAIKEMILISEEEKSVERFTREAMLMARLRHNGLPVVHDYFVENNNYYIILDFIDGTSLNDILKDNKFEGLPVEDIIEWGIQICSILEYIHGQSPPVIHRDIKPDNIIKTEHNGRIMLVDFGIASLSETQNTGSISATLGYAAPEQLMGRALPQSDLYSLGITLYQLLTGYNIKELRSDQFNLPKITFLRKNINKELTVFIEKAIELEVRNRFASAAEMKKALIEIRDGRQIASQGSSNLKIRSNTVLLLGTLLENRYEIQSMIKSGGMGSVYRAYDKRLRRVCAVKEMLSFLTKPKEQEYAVKRFEVEALMLSNLKHDNLPVVYDYFIENGKYYLIMDLIEGEDLKTILKREGNPGLPEDSVVKWAKDILKVLSYLHSQNPPIVYRDIKPSNIMVRTDGRVMLIDFGIAKTIESQNTSSKTVVGTVGYAPVEQYQGRAEPASDLYALGATMHHLLSGKQPAPLSIEPLKNIAPDISSHIEKVITKALKTNIKERFSSAEEMLQSLISTEKKIPETHYNAEICSDRNKVELCWAPVVHASEKEDFSISCDSPVIENEEKTSLPVLNEGNKHLRNLLKLESTSYVSGEETGDYPFLTEVPVNFQDDIMKGILNIDINSSFIKLLQMSKDRNDYIYPSLYMLEEVPKGSFKENFFSSYDPAVKMIKNFIKEKKLKINKVSFSVPADQSVIKTIIVPYRDNKKLPSIVKEEISSSILFPYNKAKIDSYIISRSVPGQEGCMKVLATAINKDFINKLESIGKTLGVKFNILSAHKAMFRTLQLTATKMYNMAVINVSSCNSAITIIRDGAVEHTGMIKGGLQDFIKAIAVGKDISLNKAKDILEHIEIDITRSDKKNVDFFHIIVPHIRDWITRIIKLFSSFGSGYKINKNNYSLFILCGEGATIKSLNTFTGNQVGIKCYNFKMPVSTSDDTFPEEYSPHFMSCMGLMAENFYTDEIQGEKVEFKSGFLSSLLGT